MGEERLTSKVHENNQKNMNKRRKLSRPICHKEQQSINQIATSPSSMTKHPTK